MPFESHNAIIYPLESVKTNPEDYLKLNEILNETYNKQILSEQQNETNDNLENPMTFYEDSEKKAVTNEGLNNVSNGLENFEINEETPELFNQETNLTLDTEAKENNSLEEDELEIPAFLRRQKN